MSKASRLNGQILSPECIFKIGVRNRQNCVKRLGQYSSAVCVTPGSDPEWPTACHIRPQECTKITADSSYRWVRNPSRSLMYCSMMILLDPIHPVADDTFTLTENFYFRNEMRMLLEKAGFRVEAEKGD